MPKFREGRSSYTQKTGDTGSGQGGKTLQDLMKEKGVTMKSPDSILATIFRRLPLAAIFIPDEVGDGTRVKSDEGLDTKKSESIIKRNK
jgi:hypothetical protein